MEPEGPGYNSSVFDFIVPSFYFCLNVSDLRDSFLFEAGLSLQWFQWVWQLKNNTCITKWETISLICQIEVSPSKEWASCIYSSVMAFCSYRTFIKAHWWCSNMAWFCQSVFCELRVQLHCINKKRKRREVYQWVTSLFVCFFRCGHVPWATWMQLLCCISGTAEPSLFLIPLGDCHWQLPGLGAM